MGLRVWLRLRLRGALRGRPEPGGGVVGAACAVGTYPGACAGDGVAGAVGGCAGEGWAAAAGCPPGGVTGGAGAAARVVISAATTLGSHSSGRRSTVSPLAVWQMLRISATEGLPSGSLTMQRVTNSCSCAGSSVRSGSSCTIR